MSRFKKMYGDKYFKDNEMKFNLCSSLIAGCFAAAVTNPLECITVNKQTSKSFDIREFVKKEGLYNVCMKGMLPRVSYNGL